MPGAVLPSAVLLAAEPITRDGAQRAAGHELAKQIYQQQRPSPLQLLLQLGLRALDRLLAAASGHSPGGGWGALVVVLLVIGLALLVRRQVGPLRRTAARDTTFDLAGPTSSAEHRRRAAAHAAAGRHAEAVRESLRAIARMLDERALVEPHGGRTADEVAALGAAALPAVGTQLADVAGRFDAIWYGGRPATSADSSAAAAADAVVAQARPAQQLLVAPR